jgi:hypothetical protein
MPKIPTSEARPGQKLTRPAVTRTGLVMVQPGTELTSAIIDRLQNLGIDTVFVEGEAGSDARSLEVALQELDARFVGHEDDAWMMELKAIVARRLSSPIS